MKEIGFKVLMRRVKFFPGLKKPYLLAIDGKTYEFAGTEEIVPFLKTVGWDVRLGKDCDNCPESCKG